MLLTLRRVAPSSYRTDCDIVADYDVSPRDYIHVDAFCIQRHVQQAPSMPVHSGKVAIIVKELCNGSIPGGLFNDISGNVNLLSHVNVTQLDISSVIVIPNDTFQGLTNVKELSLIGFQKVKHVDADVFRPLRALERLVLSGFGSSGLTYKDLGYALSGLSGTPLGVLVLDQIRGLMSDVPSSGRLDLRELFQIREVSIRTWAFTGNVVTEYAGLISESLPTLRNLCFEMGFIVDVLSSVKFLTDIMSRNEKLRKFYLFVALSDTTSVSALPDWVHETMDLIKTDMRLFTYLTQFPNNKCYLGFVFPFSPYVESVAVRGNILYFPDGDRDSKVCIQTENNLKSILVSSVTVGGLSPVLYGANKLQNVSLDHIDIDSFSVASFESVPALESFVASRLQIADFVAKMDKHVFGACPRLRVLSLVDCHITKISKDSFELLPNLVHLDVSNNQLTNFDVNLQRNTNLTHLDLSRNAITTLPNNFTTQADVLADLRLKEGKQLTINLTGNYLSCHCNNTSFVRWITKSITTDSIHFEKVENYECILPNGTRVHVIEMNVDELDDRCSVVKQIDNNTKCPCDADLRDRLKLVQYSLDNYFCWNEAGQLISMKNPLTACTNIYLRAQFIAPVATAGAFVVALVSALIFLYRNRRNKRLQPIVDCIGLNRIVGAALNLLMLQTRKEDPALFACDVFLYVHVLDHVVEQLIVETISAQRVVLTQNCITPGTFLLESLNECTRQCRWIVTVLTPASVEDAQFMDYIDRVLFDRPHALVPIVWTPLTADESNDRTIAEMFRASNPLCWPGDGDSEAMMERRDLFWRTLFTRIDSGGVCLSP